MILTVMIIPMKQNSSQKANQKVLPPAHGTTTGTMTTMGMLTMPTTSMMMIILMRKEQPEEQIRKDLHHHRCLMYQRAAIGRTAVTQWMTGLTRRTIANQKKIR
jgi:hypothetical protein